MTEFRATFRYTRRRFLRQGSIAGMMASAYPAIAWAPGTHRDCVVIGAGLAGLMAAWTLTRAGWKVTVLEAQTRTGGRVESYRFKEAPGLVCELGGEWIGNDQHRIIALAKQLGLELEPHAFRLSLLAGGQFLQPGEWRFSPSAIAGWKTLCQQYKDSTEDAKQKWDRFDWWSVLKRYGFTERDLHLRDLMDSLDFGESIRFVSANAALEEYVDTDYMNPAFTDEMDLHIKGGNSKLPDALARALPETAIHLGVKVKHIAQAEGKVTVTTDGGTFDASHCICTVPASVLTDIEFSPELPEIVRDAAQELDYARIVKLLMLADRRFWPYPDFSMLSDLTAQQYFHSTFGQPAEAGILCSYSTGDKADVIAAQTESEQRALMLWDLKATGWVKGDPVRSIRCKAWQLDPNARGAYAMYRPGQWSRIRPLLAAPHGRVLFAGEHLADEQGFMEGALVTGEQAAETLLRAVS